MADRLDALAGPRRLLVLEAGGYRTYGRQCGRLLTALAERRGPATLLFATSGTKGQRLYRLG